MTQTAVTLHTFSEQEIQTIERALATARDGLFHMATYLRRTEPETARNLWNESEEMGALLLKIQASR